jgi:alkanesulfonate monooxygenase SsuD/methylene tetrahydromethanopterin reductase-like flavin-dependent oxidoreductase (luciferase family)
MELVLKAWTEAQPFGWQGRHYQFRTVSVWPRPAQQPHPPTYALGTSRESCEFAARHRLGLGVSYAPFEVIAKATRYYREQCAQYGWEPAPEQIIYRANILVGETDTEAQELLEAQRRTRRAFPLRPPVRDALLQLDSRNVAGEARTPNVGGVLPTNFVGAPDTIVGQIKRCREESGAGVIDLMFRVPSAVPTALLMRSIELFGTKVLPHIREV